jgi:hypothetical protein
MQGVITLHERDTIIYAASPHSRKRRCPEIYVIVNIYSGERGVDAA